MKVVITGGHLSPALSVIEALGHKTDTVFIGRKHVFDNDYSLSLEFTEISKRNIPFYDLRTGRLKRHLTWDALRSFSKVPKGFFDAYTILQKEKPDCVLSFGGYIGLPVVIAGALLKIPTVIHEQTFYAGYSNKLASRFATKVCVSWNESRKFFPDSKTVLTGNPLRKSFLKLSKQSGKSYEKPMIYITGGSAGSHEVNELIKENLKELLEDFVLIHQTGDSTEYQDNRRLQEHRDSFPKATQKSYILTKFTSEKEAASYMRDAEVVVSRSGINTVTELLYLRKKAYLIPLSVGQRGEQLTNARFLKKCGLAEIHRDRSSFVKTLKHMAGSADYTLSDTSYEVDEHAADNIVRVLENATKK